MSSQLERVRGRFRELAREKKRRILLPEAGGDERTIRAALQVHDEGFAEPVLLGSKAAIENTAGSAGLTITGLEIVDPAAEAALLGELTALYQKKRAKEHLTDEQASALVADPLYFGSLLVAARKADGLVSGAITTTADVMRATIKCIGVQPGLKTVSSNLIMVVPDCEYGDKGVMLFADCAVIIEPTVEQLADIAIATADMARQLVGLEPKVAMLSFSTRGSAQHPSIDKMRAATDLVRQMRPDIPIDGEMQADAALVPAVGKRKAPDSPIAGQANVLIFPDLDAGNIGYKLVQRLCGAEAIGTVSQGLALPVNDLSRGCSVQDVADVVAITAAKASFLGV